MFVLYALACYYATILNHINPRFFSFTSMLPSDISLFRTHTHFFASSIMLSGCRRLQQAEPAGGAARRGLRPALPPTGKRLPLTHPGQGGDPRLFTADRINNSPRSVRSAPPESAPRSVSFCPFGLLLTLSPARSPRLFLPRGSTPAAVRGSPPAACRWDLPLGVAAHCAGPGRRSCVRRLQ